MVNEKKKISNDVRRLIVSNYNEGRTVTEIASNLVIPRTSVQTVVQIYKQEGRIEQKNRGCCQRTKISEEMKNFMRTSVDKKRHISLRMLSNMVFEHFNVSLSKTSVDKCLKSLNYTFKRSNGISERALTSENFTQRNNYTRKRQNHLTEKCWSKNALIDEVGFNTYARSKNGGRKTGQSPVQRVHRLCTRNTRVCCTTNKNQEIKKSDENELVTNPSISIERNEITSQGLSEDQQQQQQQHQQQQQQEHQQQQLTSANISNMPASSEAPLVISVEEVQDFELPDQNFRYNIMNTTNELQENPTKFVPKIKTRLKHCRSVRGHGTNKKPKEWMREYWRIKKRESRARQDYWRKRVLHESIPGQASTTVPTGEPICNQAFDINTNIPCDDGQPNKKNVQLHSPPALVQPQASVVPTPSPVPKLPTYKFQMQHHQSCVMTQLYQMWKSRLFCNAAISNGTHTILVHRDLLIATCTKLLEIPNTDALKGDYLQLTFTPDIQEEALWAFCTYMYEGVLVLNSDILYNMECIAKILGVYNILSLVDRYKQCTMENQSNTPLKSSNEEQIDIYFNYQITNRFQIDNDCDGGPSQPGIKVKQETDPTSCSSQNTVAESQNNLNKSDSFLNYEHVDNKMTLTGLQYQKTICNLSQMITGMISHNQPDYSTSIVIEVEVDSIMSNSCPNINTQSNTTLSPVSLTTVSGEQLPLDLPHTQIKTE
uniref:BTB domain-containing protein n=1 Tax=Octopus bimaculoides TaxID=37653 RepID=A0A0L8H0C3_OCTBM